MKFIYFDTEFTSLMPSIEKIKLISAGFVSDDGQELYIELPKNYKITDCSLFVEENVLPHLDNTDDVALDTLEAVIKLQKWVESFNEPTRFVSDAPQFDWALINHLFYKFGDHFPKNLSPQCMNVSSMRVETSRNAYFQNHPEATQHHSLWDARALAYACKIEDVRSL